MKKLLKRTEDRLFQSFLLLFLCLFFLASPTYAQGGFAVKGVVVDKTGFPLPGTNVMEKGTTNGTIIGFDTKEEVVKDKNLNITLEEDSKLLNEVVVVGYGTMKKRDVTGAITSISSVDTN